MKLLKLMNINNLFKNNRLKTQLKNFSTFEELLKANPSLFDLWFVQALNGQYKRLQFFLNLCSIIKPTVLIETGTYLGSSTIFFAQFISQIYTIESEKKYFDLSQKRFKNLNISNIKGVLGDSELTLRLILKEIEPDTKEILVAYLDAHWYEKIPTTQELNQLIDWGGPFIAMIDDFKVEDDPGYNYDEYNSVTVGVNLIPRNKDLFLFYPKIKAELESGARRGLGIILNAKAKNMIDPTFLEICKKYEI